MNKQGKELILVRSVEHNETWFLIKEITTQADGSFESRPIKSFTSETDAREFFARYQTFNKGETILASKVLESAGRQYLGEVVAYYRGVTITDRPHGTTPFTLVMDGQIIPHVDTRNLLDAFLTIDEILKQSGKEEDYPKPDWLTNLVRLLNWDLKVEAWQENNAGDYPEAPMLIGSL